MGKGREGAAQAAKGAEAAVASGKKFPLVTTFGVVSREGQFHAVAVQTRGREVVREVVLDTSEGLLETTDRCELALKEWALFGVDPFKEPTE